MSRVSGRWTPVEELSLEQINGGGLWYMRGTNPGFECPFVADIGRPQDSPLSEEGVQASKRCYSHWMPLPEPPTP